MLAALCADMAVLPPAGALLQGSHYYFEGVKLAQGRENVLQHLKDNPDTQARLSTAVRSKMAELGSSAPHAGSSNSSEELDDELFAEQLRDGIDYDELRELEAEQDA